MKLNRITILLLMTALFTTSACREKSTDLDTLLVVEDFELTDQNGKRFHFTDLKGNIVILFFGYTSCPDVCPATLAKVATVYRKLGDAAENVKTVMITVDPARDTPEKLKEYLSYFKYDPIGLTGTEKEVDEVTKLFSVFYAKRRIASRPGYEMDHTTGVFVIDQKGEVRHIFNAGDRPEALFAVVDFMQR